jgi:5-formyltetrahydrofolate cyclo-ligase
VCSLSEWRAADAVLLYHALPDEVGTAELLRDVLASGKLLYLPRIRGRRMTFHLISDEAALESLRRHRFGMLEPRPEAPRWDGPGPEATALVVCPGRAFDRSGHRLGRGGGYYDRFLARRGGRDRAEGPSEFPPRDGRAVYDGSRRPRRSGRVTSIGICYEVQLVRSLPVADHDVAVDLVVTEARTLRL